MRLFFKGQGEYVRLDLDRKTKVAKIATSLTDYKPKNIDWKMLFDKGREKKQEKITDKLNDKEFVVVITAAMADRSYTLIKVVEDEPGKDRK